MTATGTATLRPRNHAEAVAHLVARRTELLAVAEMQTEMAARLLADGDSSAASELIGEAKATMARVAQIDACRK